jgi:hypothetical protein
VSVPLIERALLRLPAGLALSLSRSCSSRITQPKYSR